MEEEVKQEELVKENPIEEPSVLEESQQAETEVKEEENCKKTKEKRKKINKEKDELIKANLELKEKVLRITAEMQNMRRRYDLDLANAYKYDGFDIIEKLLPVIDNFERAMMVKLEGTEKFLEGFKMIYDNFVSILEAKGVKEVVALNKEFDPSIMNAVLTEVNPEVVENVVLEVLQKGYMYNDKLIRPAMVKVNERKSE